MGLISTECSNKPLEGLKKKTPPISINLHTQTLANAALWNYNRIIVKIVT